MYEILVLSTGYGLAGMRTQYVGPYLNSERSCSCETVL